MASHNSGASWTAELNQKLLQRIRQGTGDDSIAAEFGRSALSIRCQKAKLLDEDCEYNKFYPLNGDEIKTFREDVSYGKSIRQLALSYELPVFEVKKYIQEYKDFMTSAYGGKPSGPIEPPKETEETKMKLFKIETVVEIDGVNVANLSDDKIIEFISQIEDQINKLSKIETHSLAIDDKIEQLNNNAFQLAKILDSRIK